CPKQLLKSVQGKTDIRVYKTTLETYVLTPFYYTCNKHNKYSKVDNTTKYNEYFNGESIDTRFESKSCHRDKLPTLYFEINIGVMKTEVERLECQSLGVLNMDYPLCIFPESVYTIQLFTNEWLEPVTDTYEYCQALIVGLHPQKYH